MTIKGGDSTAREEEEEPSHTKGHSERSGSEAPNTLSHSVDSAKSKVQNSRSHDTPDRLLNAAYTHDIYESQSHNVRVIIIEKQWNKSSI